MQLGSIDDLIQRGARRSAPVTAVACAALRLHVDRSASLDAALRALPRVTLPLAPFRELASDEMALADLFGRLEVAARYQRALEVAPVQRWTQLEPAEAVEAFRRRRLLAPRELGKLLDAYRRKATRIATDLRDFMLGKVGDALEEAIRIGTSKGAFVKGLAERFDAWGLTRAKRHHVETVFDTTVLGSYAHGRYRQLRDPGVLAARPLWRYVTAGDGRVRPAHRAMQGKIYPADSSVWATWFPPNGFRCFLPGTRVSGSFVAGLEAPYSGPAVELETLGGRRLSVTANHPVLTDKGWVAADQIHEGQHLVCHGREIELAASLGFPSDPAWDVDDQQCPARVEDVFETLRAKTPVAARIRLSPLDLHGDGRFVHDEVDVVGANGKLGVGFDASLGEFGYQTPFVFAHPSRSGRGPAEALSLGHHMDPGGFPRRRALPLNGLFVPRGGLALSPFQPLSLGTTPNLDAVLLEKTADGWPTDAEFARKLENADPGKVLLDRVVAVRRFPFSGHVYDFQTVTGFIIAESVVVSNCRCSVESLTQNEARELGGVSADPAAGLSPDEGFAGSPKDWI